jgi:hypothetical protein
MSDRGASYFFIGLIEKYVGVRCWFALGAFTAIVGGTASMWVSEWILSAVLAPPTLAVFVRCVLRRNAERRRNVDGCTD